MNYPWFSDLLLCQLWSCRLRYTSPIGTKGETASPDGTRRHTGISVSDLRVRSDQVRQLYSQAKSGLVGAALAAGILVFALRDVVSHSLLALWLIAYLGLQVPRHLLVREFSHRTLDDTSTRRWGLYLCILTTLSGLMWGLAGVVLFPPQSPAHQFLLALFISGISAAAAVSYAPRSECYWPTLLATLVPLAGRYFYEGGEVQTIIATVILLFAVVLILTARRMNLSYAEAIRLRVELGSLAESVFDEKRKTEQLNADLRKEVDERRTAQAELMAAKERAEAGDKAKSEFLANMSHELRTPLNAIIGFSEILEDQLFGILNERQSKYVRHISNSGRHLLHIVNDILDLARIESGKTQLDYSAVDLEGFFKGCVLMIKEQAKKRGLHMEVNIEDKLVGAPIQADEVRLKQIMFNLLSNAAKFTPEGGRIEVEARRKDGYLQVMVADNGIGLAPENKEVIFGTFERVDSSLSRNTSGTGLGLALTKQLAELHGGRIWVDSAGVGKGAVFTFAIPYLESPQLLDHERALSGAPSQVRAFDEEHALEDSWVDFRVIPTR